MSFDFSKFTTATKEVSTAFGAEPQKVVESIAKEIAIDNGMVAPDVEFLAPDVDVPTNIQATTTITADDIAKQAAFLKAQKEQSEAKEEKPKTQKATTPKETKATTPKTTPAKKEEKEIIWSRARRVIAYGDEIYTETDTTKSLDDIRKTLVTQYGFSEFKDSQRCTMKFDAKTGDVFPEIEFKKKG